MDAHFDRASGKPKVVLDLIGLTNEEKKIEALLDTGHTGKLSLPVLDLIALGGILKSFGPVEYGNGAVERCLYFEIKLKVGNSFDKIQAGLTWGSEAIAGTELFEPYTLNMDFKNKTIKFELSQ